MIRITENFEPWENLANAVIVTAVRDYKRVLVKLKRNPNNKAAGKEKQELEGFFYGSWFEMLTNLDPQYLVKRVQKMVEEKENAYKLEFPGQKESND